jgi:hypothetical protein
MGTSRRQRWTVREKRRGPTWVMRVGHRRLTTTFIARANGGNQNRNEREKGKGEKKRKVLLVFKPG